MLADIVVVSGRRQQRLHSCVRCVLGCVVSSCESVSPLLLWLAMYLPKSGDVGYRDRKLTASWDRAYSGLGVSGCIYCTGGSRGAVAVVSGVRVCVSPRSGLRFVSPALSWLSCVVVSGLRPFTASQRPRVTLGLSFYNNEALLLA